MRKMSSSGGISAPVVSMMLMIWLCAVGVMSADIVGGGADWSSRSGVSMESPTQQFSRMLVEDDWKVFDGSRLVRSDYRTNSTRREIVKLSGWRTVERDHPCGHAARLYLHRLINSRKIELKVDTQPTREGFAWERRTRRTVDGRWLAKEMIRACLAGTEEGETDEDLLQLEASCKAEGKSCYHRKIDADEWTTQSDFLDNETCSSDRVGLLENISHPTSRLQITDDFPTGFSVERWSQTDFTRPVDIVFTADGDIFVALNEGMVVSVQADGTARDTPFIDLRAITNDYHDHGMMSIAVNPEWTSDPWMYIFIVYDHDTNPDYYTEPRTSRVLKVKPSSSNRYVEDESTQMTVLGSVNGFGCDACTEANCDCLPAEGKSHVGGGLTFGLDGTLLVTIGDGGIAWIVPEALRSQQMGTFSGKVLRVDTDGKGLASNPYYTGNPNDIDSKIYALGIRNVLHIHTSPKKEGNYYVGDTMWNTREEVSVVRRKSNLGWPCWEGDLVLDEYADDDECKNFFNKGYIHTAPLIAWSHGDGTASSMIGERIDINGWPERYRDVLVYGDMASRFIGFAKLDDDDNLIEDLERIYFKYTPVQYRAGPNDSLYLVSIRGRGPIIQVSYKADSTPAKLENLTPSAGSTIPTDGAIISGQFSKSMEPSSIAANTVYLEKPDGTRIFNADLEFHYGTRSFTLTILKELDPGTTYKLKIRSGAEGVLDLDHNELSSDIIYEFQTSQEQDTTPPEVETTVPSNEADDIDPYQNIRISFTERLSEASITKSSFTIYPARIGASGPVPDGDKLDVLEVSYTDSSRTVAVVANLAYSTVYIVTVLGNDAASVIDSAGNKLFNTYTFSFTTGTNPDKIDPVIISPPEGSVTTVGETIYFEGNAYDQLGNEIPSSAFNWQINVYHCTYSDSPSCHDHNQGIFADTKSGSFKAVNHFDRFYYEVYLVINHGSESGEMRRFIETRTVDFTLTSDPAGVDLSLSGYTVKAPFTLPVAIGSTSQISAPLYHGDDDFYKFSHWEEGGSRTKEVTVGSSNQSFKAVYVERTLVPTAPPESIEIISVPDEISTTGTFKLTVRVTSHKDRDVFVGLREVGSNANTDKNVFQVGEVTNEDIVLDYVINIDLDHGRQYTLRVDLRDRDAGQDTRVMRVFETTIAMSSDAPADFVDFIDPPEFIADSGGITVRVKYLTSQMRDLSLVLRSTDPKEFFVGRSVTVTGSGEQALTLEYEPLPNDGRQYQLRLDIREFGGDKSTRLLMVNHNLFIGDFAGGADVIEFFQPPPEPFPHDKQVDFEIRYSTTEKRTILIVLHNLADLKFVGQTKVHDESIATSLTKTFSVGISRPESAPIGSQLRVRALILEYQGSTKDRLDWIEYTTTVA